MSSPAILCSLGSGILINVTAGPDLSIGEYTEVCELVESYAHPDATIVVGSAIDMEMNDEMRVTVVATGLNNSGDVRLAASNQQVKSKDITRK